MNLFIVTSRMLEPSPYEARKAAPWAISNATHLPDRHVVKMILESAQIIMTALDIQATEHNNTHARKLQTTIDLLSLKLPKPLTGGHRKHPVIKWAADKRDTDLQHIAFVIHTAKALCWEYQGRFKRTHAYHWDIHSLVGMTLSMTRLALPEYFPLCANSAADTKKTGKYIRRTPEGLGLIVSMQRSNFIIHKPWAATNFRHSRTPAWYTSDEYPAPDWNGGTSDTNIFVPTE